MPFSTETIGLAMPVSVPEAEFIAVAAYCLRNRVLHLAILFGWLLPITFGQAVGSKGSEIAVHLQKAQTALHGNDPGTAATEFRYVLSLDPKNVEAQASLGIIEMFQGDCQTASKDFRRALAIQPSLAKAKALLGICGRRLGDSTAQGLLESSFAKLTDPKMRTQVGMELVGLYYDRGDPERAIPVLQILVNLNPEDPNILYMAQRLYGEMADDTLNKLAIVAPDSARMQQVIAERLVNAGDVESAVVHYRKALEIDPSLPGMHFELAEAILESAPSNPESQTESGQELQAAVKTNGDNARTECLFGRIALLRDDLEQASVHYSKAFTMSPTDVQAQLGMGRILMAKERWQEAGKYLRMAIASDPLNMEAHYRLATVYRRLQRPEEGEKEIKLFQEIKQTKDRVEDLYRQMKKPSQRKPDDMSDSPTGGE